ncbi:MAG: signal peptidase II [Bdellovibrionia bacterium]
MNKKEWSIVLFPLFFVWFIDLATKEWANGLTSIKSFGFLHFVLHHNHGAMLGLFSELPQVLRVVSLSTAGAFILCTYAILQYLIPFKSLLLRSGLSILTGGIMGNVTDRIFHGYVIDFIAFGTPSLSSPVFNLADALQWVGYGFIVYAIIKEGDLLWPDNNSRKQYWVNVKFQLKYCFMLMGVGLSLTLISLVFSYTYIKVTISNLVGNNEVLMDKFLIPYVITYAAICVGFCVILFLIGRIISHRIAGPLYAFEKFLDDVIKGENRHFKLRAGDEFKHLEELAEQIQEKIRQLREERTVQVVEMPDTFKKEN